MGSGVAVGVFVGVGEAVSVGRGVGVSVGVCVGIGVGVNVGSARATIVALTPASISEALAASAACSSVILASTVASISGVGRTLGGSSPHAIRARRTTVTTMPAVILTDDSLAKK